MTRISLEQWRALVAVVEANGYAAAAQRLHKSQSTITYAVQKIERLLGVQAFVVEGRKARLTEAGRTIYRRAKGLIEEAEAMERGARRLAEGWAPELRIAADIIFPTWLLLQCFACFAIEAPDVRLQLHETVLGGTEELVQQGLVDLAIASHVPGGLHGEHLMRVRFIAAAHPDHPLHRLGRSLTHEDLRPHRQLVIRDTARERPRDAGAWLGAEQRWTVSHKATSIAAATMGLGFAWYPAETLQGEIGRGRLKALPMAGGGERFADLYLVYADRDWPGKAAERMGQLLAESVASLWREPERD